MNESKTLIKRLQNKDEQAFDEIYNRYFRLVKSVTLKILQNDTLAEDMAQETFLKMYENIASFTYETSFSAWLCTIAKNLSLNEQRKQNRLTRLPDYDIEDKSITPSEYCNEDSTIKQIKELLGEKDYELVMLRLYHNLSYKEISDMYNQTIPALANRYHRAVKKIKKNIKI